MLPLPDQEVVINTSHKPEHALEKRLHPMSFLFVLMMQLKQFALPLLVLLFTGRSDNPSEWWGLIAVFILALYSLGQYFTYRYRVVDDGIIIRNGVFQKSLRHITFDRIQNVSLQQNILHQIFKVAEVKLETAGGTPGQSEGQMRVLSLHDAQALEQLVRARGQLHIGNHGLLTTASEAGVDSDELLVLNSGELIRLGLISNKGMVVVATFIAALTQTGDNFLGGVKRFIVSHQQDILGYTRDAHLSQSQIIGTTIIMFVLFVFMMRLLSVLLALMQFHRFRLAKNMRRLSIERGLFTRLRGSLPLRRIQSYSLNESWLHRCFKRQSLRVDTVTQEAVNAGASLRDVVPLARAEKMDALIRVFIKSDHWPLHTWQGLHPKAWRRKFFMPAVFYAALSAVLGIVVNPYWFFGLVLVPWQFLYARNWARYAGFAYSDDLIAVRQGWLSKKWRFAEIAKLQALVFKQGPLDRRHDMASLHLDTAGASPVELAFQIDYLPMQQAKELQRILAQKILTKPLPF
jgi:putative membrane protein